MISLVYVSSATKRPSRDELVDLLRTCHANNSKQDITGLLLYNGVGTFLQVLEGEQEAVLSLFEKIKVDSRHRRVNVLSQITIVERSFGNWKMGFRDLSNQPVSDLPNFSSFMQDSGALEFVQRNSDAARKMLMHFKNLAEELAY